MKLKQREIFCRYLNSSRGGTQTHVSALDHSATQFHAKYNYFCSITSQETFKEPGTLTLSQQAIFFTTSDILIELFYNVNISARIHPPLKQRTPLKS
jgi:hypothetical protein